MSDDLVDDRDVNENEVSAAEAARLTGISVRTIRRKIAANALPARRVAGKRYAIQREDLSGLAASPAGAELVDIDLAELLTQVGALAAQVEQVVQNLPPLLSQGELERALVTVSYFHHREV